MLRQTTSVRGWHLQVILRQPSDALIRTLSGPLGGAGIYLIGCAREIVYVGQSYNLRTRPIESLGKCYHQVPDITLPWSIAFARCPPEEMNERESTAIRRYAPKFNTSIPSVPLSEGRMPEVTTMAPVFKDQEQTCAAFEPENLLRQSAVAQSNPSPPWKRKRTRRKTHSQARRTPKVNLDRSKSDFVEPDFPRRSFAIPRHKPLPFKINLCEGNEVITRDGVIIGTWIEAGDRQISFQPDGISKPIFGDDDMRLFCERIREWYESETGGAI